MRNLLLLTTCLLGACATTGGNGGWHGENAQPYDGAKAACEAEVAGMAQDTRTQAFEACMATRGWHRP